MDDRRQLRHATAAQHVPLQVVLGAEDHGRHRGPVRRAPAPPAASERRGGRGHVAQRAKRLAGAPLHRLLIARHRGEHVAAAQQLLRVGLVLHLQPDRGAIPPRRRREHVAEPGGQGVGVDRHRQLDGGHRAERRARLVVQQPRLPAEAYQPFAVRCRPARRAPADQHLARHRLQRADPLADRARGDVQLPGGRLEAPVLGDGDQAVQLARVEVHGDKLSTANGSVETFVCLHTGRRLASKP